MSAIRLTQAFDKIKKTSSADQDLVAGREALRLESAALLKQADQLDERFVKAVETIITAKGRVIVTGMGKPGHVGKKVVATFASTGTPAHFVHPAEASHGDLGMITENDVVLALSKSGETSELRDVINYCKRFSVTLIAMTANPESTLGRQADLILPIADAPEACPNQQAPTTSTTLMMAMGDALAIALMNRRSFTSTDFRQYHPGGKLGGQLLSVATVMQKEEALPTITDTATMNDAQKVMSQKNFGCAIVVNARDELVGFVSDGDIRRHLSPDLLGKKVSDIMGHNPRTIALDSLCSAALAVMNQHNITQLIVVDGNIPVGLLRLHDIMRAGVA